VPDFKEVGTGEVEWWWILLAVLGGILLLALIIFILYKVSNAIALTLYRRCSLISTQKFPNKVECTLSLTQL
jgi:hypothetical protein